MMISDELNVKIKKLGNEYATALNRLRAAKNDFENETKRLDELQRQYEHFEIELDEITRNRLENNDALIKIHKEIMEQNSKIERAKRELKIAKKAMMKKVGDLEYVRLLEVSLNKLCNEAKYFSSENCVNATSFHSLQILSSENVFGFTERYSYERARRPHHNCASPTGLYG